LGAGWILTEAIINRRAGIGLLWSGIFFISSILALIWSWPNLWEAPVQNFISAFESMSKFRWDLGMLFDDRYIFATDLPWNYIPLWFIISMPLLFLVAGACGILRPFWLAIVRRRFDYHVRAGFFLILCFVLPVLSIIVMKSVLYDSWRHMYFIYAPFVLLSAGALHELSAKSRGVGFGAVAVLILPVCWFHFNAHPFQYVHFNCLTDRHGKEDLRDAYEMDYWGVGYKQGLEYVLAHDTASKIPVSMQNLPGEMNYKFLPAEQRKRIKLSPVKEARYFLTNYRWHPQPYDDLGVQVELIKSFKVCGNTVHGVYRVLK
jgi:hypothetical protein